MPQGPTTRSDWGTARPDATPDPPGCIGVAILTCSGRGVGRHRLAARTRCCCWLGEPEDDRIVVAMSDGQVGAGMQPSTLSEGDQLLLYLWRETETTAPGVDGDVVIPTGSLLNRLDDVAPPRPPPFSCRQRRGGWAG